MHHPVALCFDWKVVPVQCSLNLRPYINYDRAGSILEIAYIQNPRARIYSAIARPCASYKCEESQGRPHFRGRGVLAAQGNVLWESGGTNADGVITDTAGNELPTEFFSPSQQTFQPHFWTGNPITSDQQVEIYEEMILDPQTTDHQFSQSR